MRSMTLFMLSTGPPPAALFDRAGVDPELLQMRANVLARRRHQRGAETIIDVIGDGLHVRMTLRQRIDHLPLAHQAMLDVAREQVVWIAWRRAVRREQCARTERADPPQRSQVFGHASAAAPVDHHAAALDDEVAREHRSTRLM